MLRGGSSIHCFQVDLKFENVGFCGGRKPGVQSNLSNTDTEGTEQSVRIREVSVV